MVLRARLGAIDQPKGRSNRKREAILDAAADLFLEQGFLGTSMDQVAARAAVSKQTVYTQFASKEALFVGIVRSMTGVAGSRVQTGMGDPRNSEQLAAELLAYAERQLAVVLTPPLMKLRRLVIAESGRFPELGRELYDGGPGRAIKGLSAVFSVWADRGLLVAPKPLVAAQHFNWLLMGEPISRAMMLGDAGIPKPAALRRHAGDAVKAFLAAYGAGRPQKSVLGS